MGRWFWLQLFQCDNAEWKYGTKVLTALTTAKKENGVNAAQILVSLECHRPLVEE